MEDDELDAGPTAFAYFSGPGMKPQFYSATRARRPRFVPLEDADEMFAQLDNGNLSDVGDTEDEEDDDFVFEETGSNDGVLETREASDESGESDEEPACQETSWCRKAFQKPSTDFRGVCDENEPFLGELPTPYEYFSRYVPKSVFVELADKTNMYSVFKEVKSVLTNEEEIRKLMSLHLFDGRSQIPPSAFILEACSENRNVRDSGYVKEPL
ncbi:hypothetical protein HPB48_012071 [Haemaphysalis longicornis]|uniref:PiggyBac transposable element-derived protein domain-containing protein n=1 Tax=Haemaphysalis longicornis TaxID=44386 RepID=A0A9J6GU14_HAELO|nr:hypothetical protein HPB48_012071 [Haemaphysalis longicornis]